MVRKILAAPNLLRLTTQEIVKLRVNRGTNKNFLVRSQYKWPVQVQLSSPVG